MQSIDISIISLPENWFYNVNKNVQFSTVQALPYRPVNIVELNAVLFLFLFYLPYLATLQEFFLSKS